MREKAASSRATRSSSTTGCGTRRCARRSTRSWRASQRHVTGEVRLRLEPGRCFVAGRRAEHGLYDYELATYEAEDAFRHEDAAGFVRLWGLGRDGGAARQGAGPADRPAHE